MTQHTPGPWAVNDSDTGMNDSGTIEGGGIVIVPDVYGRSLDECKANAALIAAAPELLETVRNLVALASVRGRLDDYKAALTDAKAVIARAEGKGGSDVSVTLSE